MRRLLAALLLIAAAVPASAATPNWGRAPYRYVSVEQDIRDLLKDFAARLGLTIQMSERVQGTVRGRLPPAPPRDFLEQLARTYGLLWYWDGFILWVYSLEEADSRVLKLQTAGTQQLADALAELDIWDDRFPIRASQSSSILHVTGPPRYVELVNATAEMLEANRNVAIDIRVFPLRYASAEDRVFTVRDQSVTVPGVATILRRLLDTGELSLPSTGSGVSRRSISSMTRFRGPAGVEFVPAPDSVPFDPAGPGGATVALPKENDTEVRIQSDPRLNAIVIRDLADRMPVYERLIQSLDRKQPLVEMEVVIADVSSNKLLDLGVDWQVGVNDDDVSVGVGDADLAVDALRRGLTFTTAITPDPVSVLARIRLLESRGEARILSRPAILTFDNVEALFDQSESFFVQLEGDEAVELAEITTGLLVKVTPRVIDEGGPRPKLQMTIDIEDGTSLPTQSVDSIPSVQRTTISTQGMVTERQGLVIGGFYRERQLDNLDKVPVLGDIPVVGWALFQRRNREQTSITRLFMIRPIVVPDTDERAVVSGSISRDGPPVALFRSEADLLTPDRAMTLDEVRFGTLLGDRVLGRAENTLCLARATLGDECKAGPMPPIGAAGTLTRLEAEEAPPQALPPPPALY